MDVFDLVFAMHGDVYGPAVRDVYLSKCSHLLPTSSIVTNNVNQINLPVTNLPITNLPVTNLPVTNLSMNNQQASTIPSTIPSTIDIIMPDVKSLFALVNMFRIVYPNSVTWDADNSVVTIKGMPTIAYKTMDRRIWRATFTCNFDIDALAINRTSMYMPGSTKSLLGITMSSILKNIRDKKFTIVSEDVVSLLPRVVDMVCSGWSLLNTGNSKYYVTKWSNFYQTVRTTECCICQDRFKEDDVIVYLTKCQHAFHGYCDQKYCSGGLCKWFQQNEQGTCPMCRIQIS
jgi:hypothetical protein